jgi:hypothetical protein
MSGVGTASQRQTLFWWISNISNANAPPLAPRMISSRAISTVHLIGTSWQATDLPQ